MFPHHENEIAQSEGALKYPPGRRFVEHWMHGSHLLVEGKKMSKSLGNFFTLRDLLAKGFSGREIRYLLLTAHYRAQFNFTLDGLAGARASLARLDECTGKLRELAGVASVPPEQGLLMQFTKAMDDDLNVSAAWGAVFEWVSEVNRKLAAGSLKGPQAASALEAWNRVDEVFGLGTAQADEAPGEVLALVGERQAARKAKDFKRSDEVRDKLKALGWVVEDTPKGPRVKRL
jgi:cysteinyl-tRNA synthetase